MIDGVRRGDEWEEVEHVEGWSGQGWSEEGDEWEEVEHVKVWSGQGWSEEG